MRESAGKKKQARRTNAKGAAKRDRKGPTQRQNKGEKKPRMSKQKKKPLRRGKGKQGKKERDPENVGKKRSPRDNPSFGGERANQGGGEHHSKPLCMVCGVKSKKGYQVRVTGNRSDKTKEKKTTKKKKVRVRAGRGGGGGEMK